MFYNRKKAESEIIPDEIIPGQTETSKIKKPSGERRFRPIFDKVTKIESGINELKESQNKLIAEIEKLKATDKKVHEEIKPEIIIPESK
jgi:hypothetical protein